MIRIVKYTAIFKPYRNESIENVSKIANTIIDEKKNKKKDTRNQTIEYIKVVRNSNIQISKIRNEDIKQINDKPEKQKKEKRTK